MEALELKPPRLKLKVVLVRKEFDDLIPEFELNPTNAELEVLRRPSVAFREFVKRLALNLKPDFATDELGHYESVEKFVEKNVFARVFNDLNIPFYPADVSEYAKAYLASSLDELRERRDAILSRIAEMGKEGAPFSDIEYLTEYARYLHTELNKKAEYIKCKVREAWIAKGIIDAAEKAVEEKKKEALGLHLCSPIHLEGLTKLLEDLGIKTQIITPKTKYAIEGGEGLPKTISISVKPAIASLRLPYILFFLSTDDIASPFDICMAYDAGFDIVKSYEKVTPETARLITQDAIFSRSPKGVKRTCFFISGRNLELVEEIAEVVKKCMFKPFKTSIIVDPRGAYTTSASMIAKVEDGLRKLKLGNLSEKNCVIFGTGPVGTITAVLLAKLGCKTTIVEPYEKLNQAYVDDLIEKIKHRYKAVVHGVFAPTKTERIAVLKKADVIFTAAAPGVRIIDAYMLDRLGPIKVFVDINAVKPSGVEGINSKDDMKEIRRGIYGIGSLAVGSLKYKVESEILRIARLSGEGFYDYNYALEVARRIISGEIIQKVTVTLRKA